MQRGALDVLVREAENTGSDSIILVRDGKTVVERYFGKPRRSIETMSVTKSIVSIAVGLLIADGKIRSVDEPLSNWYPEWKEGKKAKVTLRHLLTHTSGLEHRRGAAVLNSKQDRLAFVRQSKIVKEPGTEFSYSNEGSQLLSGILASAAGKSVDEYLRDRLFRPLGIKGWSWVKDRAGNTQTYYGLSLSARDLLHIGMLMLQEGQWDGKQILRADWVRQSSSQGIETTASYGLLWWLRFDGLSRVMTEGHFGALQASGIDRAGRLRAMVEKPLASDEAWWMEAGALLDEADRAQLAGLRGKGTTVFEQRPGKQLGYYADGWLGQRLVVYPEWKIVAVRQHRTSAGGDDAENEKSGFRGFLSRVESTVQP